MNTLLNHLTRACVALVLAMGILVGTAGVASAQKHFPGPHHGHHFAPIPFAPGPSITVYSPSTSSYYSKPMVQQPLAPLGFSQNYSFYTPPVVNYYPPVFDSYVPAFPSSNVYYQTNVLAPYLHGANYQSNLLAPYVSGSAINKTTTPYYTPMYFRY
jgi:hypothetical protein